ncbi:FAD-dependent oxidoreductase [Amycolatopsis antarctica]|uniref:FAD-dependent oxidoreductase n=1 Tax=Amycolatopsis antarctica TaxID=1854586 RepID=A0A263D541_9PSEU|nr:FAD-dependent oxidoreductase [Amycolatopsis antarctica]OZM73614.1 FAD-dependent oxidoreductase [Amycolatopsis antarctica]
MPENGGNKEITVVGGGIAGLVAAVACAERGAAVTLHEAHSTLGGRGRATAPPHVAHEGPHVFYDDGPHWTWLEERDLLGHAARTPLLAVATGRYRLDGRIRRGLSRDLLRLVAGRGRTAPVDVDFTTWASAEFGAEAARQAASLIGVVTYLPDSGVLSARFVWDLIRRVLAPSIPAVRYVRGGWPAVTGRLAARARELGVRIELDSRVTELPSNPTIVATELASARLLLGDETLHWDSGSCVLLDFAVTRRRGDPFVLFDLDEGGFAECYSRPDRTLAPRGEALYQASLPIREGEPRRDALARLDTLVDALVPGRRDRTTWSRDAVAHRRAGAIDFPGRTWRDRPAVDRGDGVFLAGDMVAAPGMRGEISINSATAAADGALAAVGAPPRTGRR